MADFLVDHILHHLCLSLSLQIAPTAAWEAMTSLTPVSHTVTERMERTAAYTAAHVTAQQP